MSRLTDLLARLRQANADLAGDLEKEIAALAERRPFGLNFERHVPEAVELPGRKVRKGDKVRVLAARSSATSDVDRRLWKVIHIDRSNGAATLEALAAPTGDDRNTVAETTAADVNDLVVVAEVRDAIYPGLVSTGTVERGGSKPFHTVINGENFHALQTLLFTHRGKVDCIYVDPPYNTGAKDWKYNNDYVEADDLYHHSKWLAMMERRLLVAKDLLNPDRAVLIVAIDEKEVLRLGLLLEQTYPEARIQMVDTLINPAGGARSGAFGRSDEYLYFCLFGSAAPRPVRLSREWVSSKGRTHTGSVRWDLLRRSGTSDAQRADRPGMFYPVYIDPHVPAIAHVGEPLPMGVSTPPPMDGLVPLLPIRKDGTEGRWQWAPDTLRQRIPEGRVKVSGSKAKGFTISTIKDGEWQKIERGEFEISSYAPDGSLEVTSISTDSVLAIPHTQWRISSHDSTQYGTRLLSELIPGRRFPFPKSLYAVEDALRFFVADLPDAVVLDFFAGSGTTAHAVMRLNRHDGGQRRSIIVTNNEVAAEEQRQLRADGLRPGDADWEQLGICEHITKPRIRAAITGRTPSGEAIRGEYKYGDEFPLADGLEENVEFFTLTYEAPLRVASNREFSKIAPLLWMRAGARGKRIGDIAAGWEVTDAYGVLANLDYTESFLNAVRAKGVEFTTAFIVTDEDRLFEAVARNLPDQVEPVRLYESYLRNFEIESGRGML